MKWKPEPLPQNVKDALAREKQAEHSPLITWVEYKMSPKGGGAGGQADADSVLTIYNDNATLIEIGLGDLIALQHSHGELVEASQKLVHRIVLWQKGVAEGVELIGLAHEVTEALSTATALQEKMKI